MKYFEDNKHRIQADMAYRIGMISLQYEKLSLAEDKQFPDTLNLCLLQNLLTGCRELIAAMTQENGEELGLKIPLSEMSEWGLDAVEIHNDSFEGNLLVEILISHLRNAMSHPTGTDIYAQFPSTGYNSIADAKDRIKAIAFCDSPDTKFNTPKTWNNQSAAQEYLKNSQRAVEAWKKIPRDVSIAQVGYSKFGMFRFGYQYARIFMASFTTQQLQKFVLGLSNLLAQPVTDSWDGRSVIKVVAA